MDGAPCERSVSAVGEGAPVICSRRFGFVDRALRLDRLCFRAAISARLRDTSAPGRKIRVDTRRTTMRSMVRARSRCASAANECLPGRK